MSSTTTGRATPQQPWPSRRERDGGHRVRPTTVTGRPEQDVAARAAARAASGLVRAPEPQGAQPRHAQPRHTDPDPTERLPVVVPRQRVRPPHAAPRPVPGPVEPRPGPRPPRPAVGSGVGRGVVETGAGHRVDGRIRSPRNGLGLWALLLGLVALPFGLVPVTAFVAAGLSVLALAFGVAGWSRTRSGVATNRGSAVTGAVLGLIALGLGVAGTVAFLQNPDRLVYDVDALTGSTTSAPISPIGE